MIFKIILIFLLATEVLSGKSDGKDDGKELVSEICGLDMIPKVTEKQLEEEQPNEKTEKEDTPDDSTLEHGDILMTKEQAKTFKENEKQKRAVIKHLPASHNFRWNTKTIPFHLDASLTDGLKDVIKKAHKVFEMYTCIEFNEVDANSQTFHIRYKKAAGSQSYVGKQDENINNPVYLQLHNGQRKYFQEINLGRFSMVSTVLHETMHAFGFVHEQERPDRDEYITINAQNVIIGKMKNFATYTRDLVETFAEQYDFNSIMHYGATYFAIAGADGKKKITMEAKPEYGGTGRKIGSQGSLTDSDVRRLVKLFDCRKPLHDELLQAIQQKNQALGNEDPNNTKRGLGSKKQDGGDIPGGVCAAFKKIHKDD